MSKEKELPKLTLLEITMNELQMAIDTNNPDQVTMILRIYDEETGFHEGSTETDLDRPNPVSELFSNGSTPIQRAELLGQSGDDIFRILVENGADISIDS